MKPFALVIFFIVHLCRFKTTEVTLSKKYHKLTEIQTALQAGKLTCVGLVENYLENIHKHLKLNAYVEVFEEEILAKAKALDLKIQENPTKLGKLYGMVVSIKDVICYKDHQVSGAAEILEGFTSLYSSTAVSRLLKEDALIIGRVNCDQFGMGSTNENSVYGPVLNPIDPNRVPGGSSGGSAVAVQTDSCLISLGTDTGGSVRQPAAFCGVIGLKPTYGRISRHGLLAYASSFDQIGILGKEVENIASALEVIAGSDEYDQTASLEPVEAYKEALHFDKKVKIAYLDAALTHKGLDPAIKTMTLELMEGLKSDGHEVEAVDFEYLDFLIPSYYVLTAAEASSNLSRYDGIKFGKRSEDVQSFDQMVKKSRTKGFSEEVKRRIMLGTFVLRSGYYDAYYTKAQKARRLIHDKTLEILEKFDFILMPVSPSVAFELGEKPNDPVAMYLADIYTVQANLVGIPAIALPLGNHPEGLPVGVQFMANKFEESALLAFSNYLIYQHLKAKC